MIEAATTAPQDVRRFARDANTHAPTSATIHPSNNVALAAFDGYGPRIRHATTDPAIHARIATMPTNGGPTEKRRRAACSGTGGSGGETAIFSG
jgi:hypothetical protein